MGARKRKPLALVDAAVDREYREFKKRQETWALKRLRVLPEHWRKRAAREYSRLLKLSEFEGNSWLRELTDGARARLSIGADDREIRAAAVSAALDGIDLLVNSGAKTVARMREILEAHCREWGIEPPNVGGDPDMERMLCERWWLRRLRAMVARQCEAAAIGARLVCRGVWPYASQDGVQRRRDQRARNAQALARAVLRDEDSGAERPLAEVVEGSVANPVNRRNELMTRIRGCEEWAGIKGWRAEFWTLTTPSRFHSQRMAGGVSEPNPNYENLSPAEGQRYLCQVWARARAAWKRRGLRVFGMRVAEPHHDATPHWHVLVFGSARELRHARRLLRVYALRDTPEEMGAKAHRFKADKIDPGRGDAAGYVAKYVAKNIDGFGVGLDEETGKKSGAMVRRCDTWAAAWRIRQFQFFGTPPVTVWRELRKLEGPAEVPVVERAREAADEGDYCAFVRVMGGCCAGNYRVWALRDNAGRRTEYGDEAAPVVVGLASLMGSQPVRRGHFSIRWGGPVSTPRTRVNNCTPKAGAGCQSVIDVWERRPEIEPARVAQQLLFSEESSDEHPEHWPLCGPDHQAALQPSQGR